MSAKAIFELLKATFQNWQKDKSARLGAALAYYTIFSLAPLLIIALAIAGLAFGAQAARGQVMQQISGLVGEQGAQVIQTAIENTSKPGASILATIIGLVTLILGATGVFGQLQDALNTIWEVEPKPGRGVWGFIQDRFISFAMVLGVGFLLLVSLLLSASLSAVGQFLGGLLPVPELVLQALNFLISFAVITLLFTLIYKLLPDVKIAWRDVWIGAAATALLFAIGKLLIGLYIGHSSVASTYGAASALVVILLWTYYSAQILFMGAEFTYVYANRYGSHVVPDEDAQPVTEEARAQQGIPEPKREGAAPGGASPRAAALGAAAPGDVLATQTAPRAAPTRRAGYGAVRALFSLVAAAAFAIGLMASRVTRR